MRNYDEPYKSDDEELTKCGEIFRNTHGQISYLCLICTASVDQAVDFDTHIVMHFQTFINTNIYDGNSDNSDTKYSFESIPVKITDSPLLLSSPIDDPKFDPIEKLEIESVDDLELLDVPSSQCEFCDRRFLCIGLKEAHGLGHGVGDKMFSCQYCTATFSNHKTKDEHQLLHLTCNELTECRHCHQQFLNETELNAHLTYDSQLDNVETIYEDQLEEPEEYKEDPPPTTIRNVVSNEINLNLDDEDSKLTIEDDETKVEKKTKKQPDTVTLTDLHCVQCNKTFAIRRYYQAHMKRHTNNAIVLKYCDICGRTFKDRNNLKAHMRIHSGEKPYSCPICQKRFTQSSYVKAHVRLHKGEKPFQCAICGKCFFLTSKLTEHTKNHHLNLEKHKCTLCTKEYKHKRDLKSHLMLHAGDTPYACVECPRRYASRKNLARHKKTHLNLKPYICEYCGNAFAEAAAKWGHVKRVHGITFSFN